MQIAPPCLSVIVATLDRAALLDGCLASLSPVAQTCIEPYEVIVVDQSASAAGAAAARHSFATVVPMRAAGLSAARNAGVAQASSDVVAFVDDDTVVDPRWVATMAQAFAGDAQAWVQVCGGRVHAAYPPDGRPAWLAPSLERFLSCIDFGDTPGPLQQGQWIVGANFAIRRRALHALGGFDVGLGRRGGVDLLSNEESQIVERLGRDSIFYEPRAMVRHVVGPERLTQDWFRKRVCWQAVSDVISRASFLESRRQGRVVHHDDALASLTVRDLFEPVPDGEALEAQLVQLYDLFSSGLSHGMLEFLDRRF